jgi:hypothetical protein
MKREFYKMEYEAWDEGVEVFGNGEQALILEGAYLRLCHKMYRVRGPVSADLNRLSHLWGVHYNTAKSILKKLVDFGKISLESGGAYIINNRCAQELHSRGIMSAVRAQSGRKGGTSGGAVVAHSGKKGPDLFTSDEANASSTDSQSREDKSREDKEEESAAARRLSWPDLDQAWIEFWTKYPHKVGKEGRGGAHAAFKAAHKAGKVSWGDLMAGLDRYIATKPPDRPWCNPTTWLNQGRWADQPASGNAPPAKSATVIYEVPRHGEPITAAMCPPLAADAKVQPDFYTRHIGRIFLKIETEEWAMWSLYYGEKARERGEWPPPTLPTYLSNGWSFPARWPPGHPQHKPASVTATGG